GTLSYVGESAALGGQGLSVYGSGTDIYLGRTAGTNEFYKFSGPNPSMAWARDIGSTANANVNGLTIRQNLSFIITDTEFHIWNLNDGSSYANLPFTTFDLDSNATLNSKVGTTVNCSGNNFYL